MELVDICREAGIPPGVVNLLSGDPAGITNELMESDIIKKVSITGSTRVGKLILKKVKSKLSFPREILIEELNSGLAIGYDQNYIKHKVPLVGVPVGEVIRV